MISITKAAKPQILVDKEVEWRDNLLALVRKYGSYRDIPRSEKESALRPYAHADIKQALGMNDAKVKCAFCESYINDVGFPNVEHYHPKSLYPEETFCWDNFVVSCTQCNNRKSDYDTKNRPFINPTIEDPERLITYIDIIPTPKSNDPAERAKAEAAIENCNLKRGGLIQNRATVLIHFFNFEKELAEKVKEYKTLVRKDAKQDRLSRISDAIDNINNMAQSDQQYAGFVRYLIRKSEPIKDAISLLVAFKEENMQPEFRWCFDYNI